MNKYGLDAFEKKFNKNEPECEKQFKKSSFNVRDLRGVSLFEEIPQNRTNNVKFHIN